MAPTKPIAGFVDENLFHYCIPHNKRPVTVKSKLVFHLIKQTLKAYCSRYTPQIKFSSTNSSISLEWSLHVWFWIRLDGPFNMAEGNQETFVILISNTVCPRSSDPFYIVSYYIKWLGFLDIQYVRDNYRGQMFSIYRSSLVFNYYILYIFNMH